jgi:hypothetical protein
MKRKDDEQPGAAAESLPQSAPAPAKKPAEDQYSVEELVAASRLLDAAPDIVAAALKTTGKKMASVREAKELVKKFANREVQ